MKSISPTAFDVVSQPTATPSAATDTTPDSTGAPPGERTTAGEAHASGSPLWQAYSESGPAGALAPDDARVQARLRQATILESARLVVYMLAPYAAALWLLESFRESPDVQIGYPPHWLSFPEGFFDGVLGEGGEARVGNFVLALHRGVVLTGQWLIAVGVLATVTVPMLAGEYRARGPWLWRVQTVGFLMVALGATLLAVETLSGIHPIVPALGSAFLTAVMVLTARLDGATMRTATVAMLVPVAAALAVWVYFRHASFAYYVLAAMPLAWLAGCWWLASRRDRAIRSMFHHELLVEEAARDRDRALEALRAARDDALVEREKAERANRAKGKLLNDICHDLRQPLGALKWYAELIKDEADGPALKTAGKIVAAANNMDEMLAAMLEFARVESGQVKPSLADFPLDGWLLSLDHQVRPLAAQRGLRLSVRTCRAVVSSDPGRLAQIVRNFLVNAIRYTPPVQGDRPGRVVLGCRRSGGALRIEVWDNGIGIAPAEQERIFTPYVQLHNPARDFSKGLGLGLSIAKAWADCLGHPIGLKSRPGQGSCFSVAVPLRAQRDAPDPADPAGPDHSDPMALDLSGEKFLIVDDQPGALDAIAETARRWTDFVDTAGDPDEALRMLFDGRRFPTILICDYRLGGSMNGLQLIASIRESLEEPRLPAILVTADDALLMGDNGIARSAIQVVRKTAGPLALADAVRAALGASRI